MTNTDCVFCKIAQKKTPAKIEYEDKEIVAFPDINPKAPVHLLIIPIKHIPTTREIKKEDAELMGKMIIVAKNLAQEKGIAESGYRLIFNTGRNSGQVVDHLHLHLLGGQQLQGMV